VARIPISWSDEGIRVRFRGPGEGIEHSEGDHIIRVGVETAAAKVHWIIYINAIGKWRPPHQDEPISADRLRQIQQRVVAARNILTGP
jgi:hypothetical protein